MRGGFAGPCSLSFTESSRATRTLPSYLTQFLDNDMIQREIFGGHCDLRFARSDLCGHWEEGIWSAFDASREFHVLLRDV